MHPRKLSGPFGDELIAGGYIQRFSIFALFSLFLFLKNQETIFNIIINNLIFVTFNINNFKWKSNAFDTIYFFDFFSFSF